MQKLGGVRAKSAIGSRKNRPQFAQKSTLYLYNYITRSLGREDLYNSPTTLWVDRAIDLSLK